MISIEVRPAENADVETMAAIYVNAARVGWAHIFDEQSLQTLKPPVGRLRGELASTDPRQQALVADREGRVVAFAVVRPSQDEDADSTLVGELDQFYSDPAVWGQGVGRKLMAAAIETLRERDFTEATLWASKKQPSSPADIRGGRLEARRRDTRQAMARSQLPRPALPNHALAGAKRAAA